MITMTNTTEIRGTKYTPVGMKKNKLILDTEYRYGIYYDQIKRKQITRVIRNGEIKLENQKVNVMQVAGVEFHLREGGYI